MPPPAPGQMVKPVDSWWTVLAVDPIAVRIVPVLARRSSITPSRVTLVAHLLGIVSAVLFARGHLVAGALVFQVRFLCDCIDGKLARITGQSTLFGRDLDAWGDRILVMVNLGALGWTVDPLATLIIVGAYPVSFHLLEVRDQVLREAGRRPQHIRMRDEGYGAFMARHRLYPMPSPIEAEHLALFAVPLLAAAGVDLLVPVFWIVAAFFVLQGARYLVTTLRTGASVDGTAATG